MARGKSGRQSLLRSLSRCTPTNHHGNYSNILVCVATARRLSDNSKAAFHVTALNNSAVATVAEFINWTMKLAENETLRFLNLHGARRSSRTCQGRVAER